MYGLETVFRKVREEGTVVCRRAVGITAQHILRKCDGGKVWVNVFQIKGSGLSGLNLRGRARSNRVKCCKKIRISQILPISRHLLSFELMSKDS